ncbi:MAG TPA: glycosyltransferase family 39 protein [Candidatus Polarisedimenticolaceae bacterium]|nr:glycosyltransferase family 39 protein [Candidatus Polarisedimenticolaceae bacterium]
MIADGERSGPSTGRWWLLLAGATALHAAVAVVTPLSGDEAYYWDLSRHPAWSTFDQPPLVLWSMVPFRLVLGETALAVRAPAIVASLAIALLMLPLARRLGGGVGEAALAYLVLHATPLVLFGSSYVSTDIVMTACFVGAAWAAVAIAQGDRRGWWGFGLAAGLGFLAKFPMVAVLIAVVRLLRMRHVRAQLRTLTPWLAGATSLMLTAPVWIWGARHGWDNVTFQSGRVPDAARFSVRHVVEFVAANLALSSFVGVAFAVAWWRARARREPGWVAVRWVAGASFVLFAAFALRGRVAAHWGAPTLVLSALLLVFHRFRGWKIWTLAGAATSVVLLALVLAICADPAAFIARCRTAGGGPLAAIPADKLARMVGYDETAAVLRDVLRPGEIVASESYSMVHLVAFAAGGTLPVHLADVNRGVHGLAALYWFPPERFDGVDLVWVTGRRETLVALADICREVHPLPPVVVRARGEPVREITMARCLEARPAPGVMSRLPPGR